ncbi:hypothetical protein KP509_1Z206500 [Ceratopteris richardii]|nr:hypothetical protein KP509_1Z206500 [Ceratopteris richardii]
MEFDVSPLISFSAILFASVFMPLYEESIFAKRVSKFIYTHGCDYFPITLVMEDADAFDPTRTYIFAAEPHSVLPLGVIALHGLPLDKIKGLASSAAFCTPFVRHIWTWLGLIPASRKNLVENLKNGYSCILVPGGVKELMFMKHDCEVVYLKKRFGFIRIAVETGSPVVPCFIFGQTRVYNWWRPEGKLYERLSSALRFAPMLFWGKLWTPIPFSVPVCAVVGKPIEVTQNPNPTQDELLEVQKSFISSLQELYERHKVDLRYEGVPLHVY